MKQWKQTSVMIGLLLIEAIIMLYAVPKANEEEINMFNDLIESYENQRIKS